MVDGSDIHETHNRDSQEVIVWIFLSLLGAHCRVNPSACEPRNHVHTSNGGVILPGNMHCVLWWWGCRGKRQILESQEDHSAWGVLTVYLRITREPVENTDFLSSSPGVADLVWV